MIFTAESFLVQLYVSKVNDGLEGKVGGITKEDVPNLYNLREVVYELVG